MSALDRMVRRRQWHKSSAKTKGAPYHAWLVAAGLRVKTYQQKIRRVRTALGLPETSSDMHHVHGARI